MRSQTLQLIFGGILPLIAFSYIEDTHGPVWGTIAGMFFGVGEIVFELVKYKKVSTITWIANAMILALGLISILTSDGIWFKMQPAILELAFALFLWGSLIFKKNFLLMLAEKQNQQIPDFLKPRLNSLTFRVGIFFFIHFLIATWAAFYWSTQAWVLLKGVGLTVSMILYLVIEGLYLRYSLKNKRQS